jgi:hypothetical protein
VSNVSVQHAGRIRVNWQRRRVTVPCERHKEPMPRDVGGLFHQVTGGLRRHEPVSDDGGESPGD